MTKDDLKNMVGEHLATGEKLESFFQASYMPSLWWFFLVGPLAALGMKTYILGLTDKGLHFNKLSLLGKPDTHDYFAFKEIDEIDVGKGWITIPLKFTFQGGRKLKLRAPVKGSHKVAKIQDSVIKQLRSL